MMGRLVFLVLPIFYGWLMVLRCFLRILRIGKAKFFYLKTRETPPPCMLDPGLGRHGYLKLRDVKLHYVINGEPKNPLMLLVHGWPDFWFSWRYQLREFSKEYCVVAVDLRGFGDSDKLVNIQDYTIPRIVDDLYQLIKNLSRDGGKAVVVAHDWGGIAAYYLAAKHPEVVSRLIVSNAPHPKAFSKVLRSSWKQFILCWYMFFFQLPYFPEIFLRSEDLRIFHDIFQNGNKKFCTEDEIEAYKYIFSRPGAITHGINYYRANLTANDKRNTNDAYRVSVPVLLIWGDKDRALSMLCATQSSMYIDKFHLRVLQGSGHWSPMEFPEQFNGYVWSFLHSQP